MLGDWTVNEEGFYVLKSSSANNAMFDLAVLMELQGQKNAICMTVRVFQFVQSVKTFMVFTAYPICLIRLELQTKIFENPCMPKGGNNGVFFCYYGY